jgi:hypothetical protein
MESFSDGCERMMKVHWVRCGFNQAADSSYKSGAMARPLFTQWRVRQFQLPWRAIG